MMRVRRRPAERGFTLTELMAVVAIMGILATIATTLFVGQSKASKAAEAMGVVQATRAAEERNRAENQLYVGNPTIWYPGDGKGQARRSFKDPDSADYALWKQLNPTVDRPVQFGYRVNSGLPGDSLPAVVTERKFAA